MPEQRQPRRERRTEGETQYHSYTSHESHHDILSSSSSSTLLSRNKICSDGQNPINNSSSSYNCTTQTQNNMDNKRILRFRSFPTTIHHHQQQTEDDDKENQTDLSSGLTFPTLWKKMTTDEDTNEEAFPLQLEHQQHYQHHHHILLSPTARSKEIARGRQEMMEMIKNMPETSYELSLKDLITEQQQQQHPSPQRHAGDDHLIINDDATSSTIFPNEKRKIPVSRRKSMETNRSFQLNVFFFPAVSLGYKKNNKKQSSRKSATTCSKVSPKPPVLMEVDQKKGVMDKECWQKRHSIAAGESKNTIRSSDNITEEESNGSRNNSNKSSGKKTMGGFLPSFWSFYNKKIKSNKQDKSIQF